MAIRQENGTCKKKSAKKSKCCHLNCEKSPSRSDGAVVFRRIKQLIRLDHRKQMILPDFVKRDWLTFMLEPSNGATPDYHFDKLLMFLKKQEGVFERLQQLKPVEKVVRQEYGQFSPTKKIENRYAHQNNKESLRRSMWCTW